MLEPQILRPISNLAKYTTVGNNFNKTLQTFPLLHL